MPDPATKHGSASFFAKGRFLESNSRNSNRNQQAPSPEWPVDVNDPNHSPMAAAAPFLQEQLGHEDAHAHRLGGERKPVAARGHKNRRQTLVVVMTGGYCRGLHVAGRWA